jgi:hypothetical protein
MPGSRQDRHPPVISSIEDPYMRKTVAAITAATLVMSSPAFAWGDKGHEIITAIARDRLTPKARAWVDAILAKDSDTLTAPDMVSRATWADRWRDSGHRETASWHFVDQELSDPDLKTACFGYPAPANPSSAGSAQDCIVDKLGEFEKELPSPATPDAERILALKYVLHFVGDIHQPLHASDNQDHGGNCVHVALGGQRTTNLHSFWDTAVLAPLGDDPKVIAASLEKKITPDEARRWASGPAESWAEESYGVAKASAYTLNTPAECGSDNAPIPLDPAYQAQALRTARQQLEKAGVRLAWVLNEAAAKATGTTA